MAWRSHSAQPQRRRPWSCKCRKIRLLLKLRSHGAHDPTSFFPFLSCLHLSENKNNKKPVCTQNWFSTFCPPKACLSAGWLQTERWLDWCTRSSMPNKLLGWTHSSCPTPPLKNNTLVKMLVAFTVKKTINISKQFSKPDLFQVSIIHGEVMDDAALRLDAADPAHACFQNCPDSGRRSEPLRCFFFILQCLNHLGNFCSKIPW